MNIDKKVLAEIPDVYSTAKINFQNQDYLVAASEGRGGGGMLFSTEDLSKELQPIKDLGGCMSVVSAPGYTNGFAALGGLYPVFQGEKGGIFWIEQNPSSSQKYWEITRVFDLAFAHRVVVVKVEENSYFIVSSVAEAKKTPEDWSKSGKTLVGKIPEKPSDKWKADEIIPGIHKNHGMHLTKLNGKKVVLISGVEGLYELVVPENSTESWSTNKLLKKEVSDVYVADVDQDGKDELLTIEPFHGNIVGVYKKIDSAWKQISSYKADFGHVIWGGQILGKKRIIVGNREGEKDLVCLKIDENNKLKKDFVIDNNIGPTQITVINQQNKDVIFSANNGVGQVAAYIISD